VLYFVSQCTHLGCISRGFDCILLAFIRRLSRQVTRNLIDHCDWLVLNSCDWCIWIHSVPLGCSLSCPLFSSSPVVVFLDHGHPCFWNLNSTIPVDVVKSYVNRLFDPARRCTLCCIYREFCKQRHLVWSGRQGLFAALGVIVVSFPT